MEQNSIVSFLWYWNWRISIQIVISDSYLVICNIVSHVKRSLIGLLSFRLLIMNEHTVTTPFAYSCTCATHSRHPHECSLECNYYKKNAKVFFLKRISSSLEVLKILSANLSTSSALRQKYRCARSLPVLP